MGSSGIILIPYDGEDTNPAQHLATYGPGSRGADWYKRTHFTLLAEQEQPPTEASPAPAPSDGTEPPAAG